ncbi:MAG: hypothetical protein FJX23_04820, partial [Alphaproteobacteria bacterium]|nr:hypothetical protein [Alphaproteobacteria bacterium]
MPAYEPVQQTQETRNPSRFNLTTLSFGAVLVGVMVLGTLAFYGVASAYPKQMTGFLIAIDRFGITQVGANEQDRIR